MMIKNLCPKTAGRGAAGSGGGSATPQFVQNLSLAARGAPQFVQNMGGILPKAMIFR
jgi:hypothetical protein